VQHRSTALQQHTSALEFAPNLKRSRPQADRSSNSVFCAPCSADMLIPAIVHTIKKTPTRWKRWWAFFVNRDASALELGFRVIQFNSAPSAPISNLAQLILFSVMEPHGQNP
jgi:hypothetical protein